MKKNICGMIVLLCSVAYGMEDAKGNGVNEKIIGINGAKQGVQKDYAHLTEQGQDRLKEQTLEIKKLWEAIPVKKSSFRGCDAMPKELEFDALFKGISYKFYMTQYHDRAFGEMSDLGDFTVFVGGHCVGTFYSRSTSDVFSMIKDKK
jgi:hypothetical protein